MGHGWTDIAFLTDAQYQKELAKRGKAPAGLRTQQQQQQ